jgi:hypothetical protein
MTLRTDGLSPDSFARPDQASIDYFVDFWNDLRTTDDTGRTTWEVLEPLEREVTECLYRGDVGRAESLTAKAMLLIAGMVEP